MTDTFTRISLPNGLLVQLKEIHTTPIISQWIWYRVGSRNEIPGKTGISHWVEHMQFKGTPNFPSGVLDKAISREGGFWNAFTYLDWTTFFETMPAGKIDLALQLEADRMFNSQFDEHEVESERTVIISEREGSENEPLFRLGEAVQAASFDLHSYHHEVIGEKNDLLKISRDDLYEHYRSYYHPGNVVIALAGDFEMDAMIDRLSQLYASLPAGSTPTNHIQAEAPLEAERRIEVSGPGQTTFLQLAYRSPAASNPDFFAFSVLDSLLSGPSSLNMFGGGISNKTSRLYRALVESELAISVGGSLPATIDPYQYDIHITVHPNQSPQAVLKAVDDEIHRFQDSLVSMDEVRRAIKQSRALFAYGSENITNQAFWLGYAEMFAHYDWFEGYVSRLETITPEDIQTIARTWLNPSHRVVGTYLPTGDGEVGK